MEFVPVPNGVQVELRFTLNGNKAENTLWFNMEGPPTLTTMEDLAIAIANWWIANMAPITGNDVQLREVYVSDQTSVTGFEYTYSPLAAAFGTASRPAATSSITLAVAFRTSKRGRSYRGRNYAVGIPDNFVVKDTISSTYAEGLRAAYVILLGNTGAIPGIWSVCSRFTNGAARTQGELTRILSVSLVDNTVDNQRRRLTGRGE